MTFDFSGRIALVTGASRGIGEQIARDLAEAGAELLVTSTDPGDRAELAERFGVPTRCFTVDFTDRDALHGFLDDVRGVERIDVCVNNAGTARHGLLEDASVEDWNATMNVNLGAPFFVIQAVADVMKRHDYGRIVNISSIWGHIGRDRRAVYAASKSGIRGLSVNAAVDLAPHNILINTVSPGFTLTDMARQNYTSAERDAVASRVPLGRLAQPEEISGAVLFFASKLNTYITGQSLVVDGGYSII